MTAVFVVDQHLMHKPQFTLGHQFVLEGLFVLCYAIDYRYRKHAFAVLLAASTYAAFFMNRIGSTPFPLSDLYLGMRGFAVLLFTSADLFLRDAQKEYRRIGDKRDIPSLPFRSRLWWAFQLAYNPRGINWNVEVTGIPPKPTEKTRSEFISASFRKLGLWLVLDEVNVWILKQNPYFAPNPNVQGWQRLWKAYTCGYAFVTITQLSLNYCWTMIILSALGFTEPSDWVMPFDSLKYTYTLANFWGKTWHATYKRVFVIYAKFINSLLGLKKGTAAANAVGLVIIFFLSAVMHVFGDYAMFGDVKLSGGSMIFFMLQVPALLIEQLVIKFAQKAGIRKATWWMYVLGYVWVYSWCAFSMPYWIGPHLAKGYWGTKPKYDYGFALNMLIHEFKVL